MTFTSRVYIAAKAPRVGFAKTRLGGQVGHDRAVALYRAFLADLAARFALAPFPVGWFVTPDDAWDDLGPICGARARVLDQGEGDWTARQRRLFAGMAERGENAVVLTASDSPAMSVGAVVDALAHLQRHDVVLGPVQDGGYYLIGQRVGVDALDGIQMSTSTVFAQIVERAERLGLSVGVVEPTFDVDDASDLPRLLSQLYRDDACPATRAAVERLGLAPAHEVAP